ncbi:MAG: hypothetical protein IPH50_09000 [Rhodanobacteraceae bacterium]|nr:hypothetical protein [Rhodanobacteraceae bacterium]
MKGLPAVGMLVQRVGEKGPVQRERILYLDRAGDLVVVIALDDDEAMPRLTSARDFDRLWREDQLKLCDDEFALLSGAKVKHVAKMDRNWTAIQKIVESEPGCFDPDIRDDLLAQAKKADKGGRARKTLLRDLRRYWQSGKQKEALATHYSRAGAPGQERISDEVKKAGRRTILEQHGRVDRGLAVNPDVAKIFDTYLKKYVLKREPLTVSATYRKMIDEKFSTRHRNPAGRLIVDPLPQDSRPSERQLRYYANKRYGISAKNNAQDGVEGYEQTTRPVL